MGQTASEARRRDCGDLNQAKRGGEGQGVFSRPKASEEGEGKVKEGKKGRKGGGRN